jgi:hypothetical protein
MAVKSKLPNRTNWVRFAKLPRGLSWNREIYREFLKIERIAAGPTVNFTIDRKYLRKNSVRGAKAVAVRAWLPER